MWISLALSRSTMRFLNKFINFSLVSICTKQPQNMFGYGRDRSVSNSWPQINLIRMCKWYCLFIYTSPWTDDWDRQWISFLCSLAFDMMWFRVGWENRDNFFLLCVSCCCQRSFHLLLFFIIESLLGYSFSGGQSWESEKAELLKIDMWGLQGWFILTIRIELKCMFRRYETNE